MGTRADMNVLEKRLTLACAGVGTTDHPARSLGTTYVYCHGSAFCGERGKEFCWTVFWGLNQGGWERYNEGFAIQPGGRVPPSSY